MVFIHGGGFFFGSGLPDLYGPERLLDYNVVSNKHFLGEKTCSQFHQCFTHAFLYEILAPTNYKAKT